MREDCPVVGSWYSRCCELDLYQIEDTAQLAELLEDNEEIPGDVRFWPTREEALADLAADREEALMVLALTGPIPLPKEEER